MLLCDSRFREQRNLGGLSLWLRPSVQRFEHFGPGTKALQAFYQTTRPPPRPRPPPPPSGRDRTAPSAHADIGAESDAMFSLMGDAAAAGRAALPLLPPPSLAHVLRTVPGRAPTIETCTAAAGATLTAAGAATDRGGKLAARFGAAPARPAPPAPPAPPRAAPPRVGAASTSDAAPPPAAAPKSNGLLAEAKQRLSELGYKSFIQVLKDIKPQP